MSGIAFEVKNYNFLFYPRYFLHPRIRILPSDRNALVTAPFPFSVSYPYLIPKVVFKPTGLVYPFEDNILYFPSKINFGLLSKTQTKKVTIWNTHRFKSIRVSQIESTDANVSINLAKNEVIEPNSIVEKIVTAYPIGKPLMVKDYFKILWEVI